MLDKIAEVLVPDGYLLLGPIETTHGLSSEYEASGGMPGVYVKARRGLLSAAGG